MPSKKQIVWDLTPLFKSDDDPQVAHIRKAVEEASSAFITKWQDRSDYLSDPEILSEALAEYENWLRNFGTYDQEVYYFSLRSSQNQLDSQLKGRFNQVLDLARHLENDIQFFTLRLAKIPPEEQKRFLASPHLQAYRHFLEILFRTAKYQLSEPEEKIMNLKHQTSHSNWVKMVSAFLSKEERAVILDDGTEATKTFAGVMSLLYSPSQPVRDSAAAAINDILKKYVDVAENEINSILANKKIDDELRHFTRPDSASLLEDDMETQVVDAMINTVSSRFEISHRWYGLKAKLLGLPKLAYQDRNADYGEITTDYSYEETKDLISKVFSDLDSEFGDIFDSFIQKGQIDVYPAKGKTGGAFCAAGSLILPTYILLNHTGKLADVRTLAHEAGHGINDELMKKSQNALNFGSPLSTAEVASTFMEDFVLDEIVKSADDQTRLSLMVKKLDDDIGTIFRQTACYLFEQELHSLFREKGYLSKAEIGKLFQKHMEAYMGPAVEQSAGSENWWVYWEHIRRFFYVYSYASGLLISKSLQSSVKKNNSFITKVKNFLSAGSSRSPQEIFMELGIDITDAAFWQKGISEVSSLLDQTEALAKKLGKIS